MFRKILVLLMIGTLPMFAKSHGGNIDIYTLITYILIGSVLIMISGFLYFSRNINSTSIKSYDKAIVWVGAIVFLLFMIEPFFVLIPLPFLAFIMLMFLLIDIVPTLYKKLFK